MKEQENITDNFFKVRYNWRTYSVCFLISESTPLPKDKRFRPWPEIKRKSLQLEKETWGAYINARIRRVIPEKKDMFSESF